MNRKSNTKAETLRAAIDKTSRNYKEAVHAIVESNTGYLKVALDSNKHIIDSIQEQFNNKDIDGSVIDGVKKALGNSVEMAEDTIDTVIEAYNKQVDTTLKFNSKLIEMIKDLDLKYPEESEKLLNVIQENLESSIKLSTDEMKKIVDAYNRNTNFALNFNKTFGQSFNSQIEAIHKLQNNNINALTHWATELVKHSAEEVRI